MAAMIVEYRNEREAFQERIDDFPRKELSQKRWHRFRQSWELEQVLTGKNSPPLHSFAGNSEQEATLFSWLLETGACNPVICETDAKLLDDGKLLSKQPPCIVGSCNKVLVEGKLQLSIPKARDGKDTTFGKALAKPLKSCLVLRSRSLEEKSTAFIPLQLASKQSRSLGSSSDDSDDEDQTLISSTLCKAVSPTAAPQKSVHFPEDEHLVEVRNFIPSRDSLNNLANFDEQRIRPKTSDAASGLMLGSRSPPELQLCFSLPSEVDFDARVAEQCVCLEKAGQRVRTLTVVVGVRNLAYEKEVTVRYSLDSWKTFSDVAAQYIPNSTDGFKDRFMFNLTLPKQFKEMAFAIRYRVDGKEFWDSNGSGNYRVVDVLHSGI